MTKDKKLLWTYIGDNRQLPYCGVLMAWLEWTLRETGGHRLGWSVIHYSYLLGIRTLTLYRCARCKSNKRFEKNPKVAINVRKYQSRNKLYLTLIYSWFCIQWFGDLLLDHGPTCPWKYLRYCYKYTHKWGYKIW